MNKEYERFSNTNSSTRCRAATPSIVRLNWDSDLGCRWISATGDLLFKFGRCYSSDPGHDNAASYCFIHLRGCPILTPHHEKQVSGTAAVYYVRLGSRARGWYLGPSHIRNLDTIFGRVSFKLIKKKSIVSSPWSTAVGCQPFGDLLNR